MQWWLAKAGSESWIAGTHVVTAPVSTSQKISRLLLLRNFDVFLLRKVSTHQGP